MSWTESRERSSGSELQCRAAIRSAPTTNHSPRAQFFEGVLGDAAAVYSALAVEKLAVTAGGTR